MHPLCKAGADNAFHFKMGNTEGKTDRCTHALRLKKEMKDSGWNSRALSHGSLESSLIFILPGKGGRKAEGKMVNITQP